MSAATKQDNETTKERILTAALPLFADHGFAGTSTRMIARAADVNVATLAYYFEGKEGLYLTVMGRLHEDMAGFLPKAMPTGGDVFGWIAREAWTFAKSHRTHIRLLLRHVLDQGHHEPVLHETWSEPLLARVDGLLAPLLPQWSVARRRLFLVGVQHMLVRLSIEDEHQLAHMLGEPEDLDAEIVGWLEAFLRTQFQMG